MLAPTANQPLYIISHKILARFGEQPKPCGFLAIQETLAKFGEQKLTFWQSSQEAEQACQIGSTVPG